MWLRDAAAGGALGPSGRLHRRLPGENRLVGQKQPAAGRRADRRPAAARGNDGETTISAQVSEALSTVTPGAEFSVLSVMKQNRDGTICQDPSVKQQL